MPGALTRFAAIDATAAECHINRMGLRLERSNAGYFSSAEVLLVIPGKFFVTIVDHDAVVHSTDSLSAEFESYSPRDGIRCLRYVPDDWRLSRFAAHGHKWNEAGS